MKPLRHAPAVDALPRRALTTLTSACLLAGLSACSGGDDDPRDPPAASATLVGTAAIGAALANANVSVKDASGASVCVEPSIVTGASGGFTCTLLAGKTAPFIVVVSDPSGGAEPLVSVATDTPGAGSALVVNATPLTTAIIAQLAPDDSALAVAADPSLIDTARLAAVQAKVLAQLAAVLGALGADPQYDPFRSPITAATGTVQGNTADRVLDLLRFSTVNGVTTIATIDDPSTTVAVADADTLAAAPLAAPSAPALSLAEALRSFATSFEDCFALPPSQRVVASDESIPEDQGGAEVTQFADACEGNHDAAYLHNGYRAGQALYGLLNDPAMTGARFFPPTVLSFLAGDTQADGLDRALMILRFVDANGTAGSLTLLARRVPGSAGGNARQSEWWLHGNQQVIESFIQALIQRVQQFATIPSAPASNYNSGLNIFVNKDGPGSAGLRAVRVKGPGLPAPGVVLTRPDPATNVVQNWLNLRNKSGDIDPATATPDPNAVGNFFRLQRTAGIADAAATTVRPNPNAASNNNTAFLNWAHPLDYGQPAGSTDYIDFARIKAQSDYRFEYFYDLETAPRMTYTKTLLTPVVPATTAAGAQQWVDLTPAARRYLDASDPLGGATQTIALAWNANPLAQTIASGAVYAFDATGTPTTFINQGVVRVARGATSATATAPAASDGGPGAPFPALSTAGNTNRQIQLRYRMLDGSYKDSFWRFN